MNGKNRGWINRKNEGCQWINFYGGLYVGISPQIFKAHFLIFSVGAQRCAENRKTHAKFYSQNAHTTSKFMFFPRFLRGA